MKKVQIQYVQTYKELSSAAADIFCAQLKKKPASILGLATGSSPVGLYQELAERCKAGKVDFSKAESVNLDEYMGLPGNHPQSYRYFMEQQLFSHINIRRECTYVPNGMADDLEAEARRYDELVEKLGGIDLQLLGIGLNGHIGFNEPSDHFTAETHGVTLDESTRKANARFFGPDETVPHAAVTMGIGSIMQAKKILLVANGPKKLEIVKRAFEGPITPMVPASVLQLHPDVTVIYSYE